MINKFVFVFLDDILIFSKDTQSHQKHVRKVLQRLLENRLFVKAEKCEFSCTTLRRCERFIRNYSSIAEKRSFSGLIFIWRTDLARKM